MLSANDASTLMMRESAARADLEELARTAHHLEGISGASGAAEMTVLAAEAGRAARGAGVLAALAVLERIDDAWPLTRDALRAEFAKPRRTSRRAS